jgi:DNA-binding response OmpR family regulator
MDLDRLLVTIGDRAPAFTHQEFLLLRVFLQSPGRVFSRKQLLNLAWDEIDVGGSRKVDVHVRRLRVKLGPQAAAIVTVRGFGYRFSPQ